MKKDINEFWKIKNNPFKELVFEHILNEISLIYICIYTKDNKVIGIKYINSVTEIEFELNTEKNNCYYIVEVEYNRFKEFRFLSLNNNKDLILQRDPKKFENGWEIFFNSRNNIVLHDLDFPRNSNHQYLKDNYIFKNVNYYVGVIALILVVENTKKVRFNDIIEDLKAESKILRKLFPLGL